MHYETKQAILEEAGLSQVVQGEVLSGVSDGTNKVFSTIYKPITDATDDDEVDVYDVTAYVNGSSVPVTSLDETAGVVTLKNAPAADAVVTLDYRYANVPDSYLEKIREEAEDWINSAMDAIDPTPYNPVPATIRKLTRWYAAAQLLTRDYGFNHDTALTSKDGANKMTMAMAALDKYIAIGGASGLSDVSAAQMDVYSEAELFSQQDSYGNYVSADDIFMRGDDCD